MIVKGWVQNAQVVNPYSPWLRGHTDNKINIDEISSNSLLIDKQLYYGKLVFTSKSTKCFHYKSYSSSATTLENLLAILRQAPSRSLLQNSYLLMSTLVYIDSNMYIAVVDKDKLSYKTPAFRHLVTRNNSTSPWDINLVNLHYVTGAMFLKNNIVYFHKSKEVYIIRNYEDLSIIDLDNKLWEGKEILTNLLKRKKEDN